MTLFPGKQAMHKLSIIEGPLKDHTFDLNADPFFIGRSSKNNIQIKDTEVSRKQLKIYKKGKALFIEDLESTNGTLINNEKIPPGKSVEMHEGDTISLANTVIRLHGVFSEKALDVELGRGEDNKPTPERRSNSKKNLELVYKVTELLRQSMNIDEIIGNVLDYLLDALPRIDRVAILLFDNKKNETKRVISRSRKNLEDLHFIYNRVVVHQVITEGKAIRMVDAGIKTSENRETDIGTMHIGSVMCVPMISSSEIFGAIYVDSIRSPYGFRKDDLLLLESLSGPVAVAVEKAVLASRLQGSLSQIKIIR